MLMKEMEISINTFFAVKKVKLVFIIMQDVPPNDEVKFAKHFITF